MTVKNSIFREKWSVCQRNLSTFYVGQCVVNGCRGGKTFPIYCVHFVENYGNNGPIGICAV